MATTTDPIEAVTALLTQTTEAHGRFEETELHRVYDQEWARCKPRMP